MNTFTNSVKIVFVLLLKGVYPRGANSFLSEQTPFQKGLPLQDSKQEAIKLSPLSKMAENITDLFPFKLIFNYKRR